MLDLPRAGAHLEFTATDHIRPPTAHVEDLLVEVLEDQEAVAGEYDELELALLEAERKVLKGPDEATWLGP
jgi:hypothetical protein